MVVSQGSLGREVPQLFDARKARMAFVRAARQGAARFLLERACEDLIERLAPVLRDFGPALDLGTPGGAFASALIEAGRAGPVEHCGEIAPTDPAIAFRPLADGDLGLEAGRYGLVVSGLWLQGVNDLPGILAQVRRALRPDGLFLACFAGGESLAELRDSLLRAESEIRGAAGLRVFPFADVRAAGALLQRAGLALPVTDSERLTIRYGDFLALAREWRAMGASASLLRRPGTPPLTRGVLIRAAELYASNHADADGRLRATIEILWMSGWAPHASQPQPLKPGSAQARLTDALAEIARRTGP